MHRLLLLVLAVGMALCFGLMTTSCEDDDDNDTVVVTNVVAGDDDDNPGGGDGDDDPAPDITEGDGTLNPGESDSTAIAVSHDGAVTLSATSSGPVLDVSLIQNGAVVDSDTSSDTDLAGHASAGDTWTVELVNHTLASCSFSWRFTVTPD